MFADDVSSRAFVTIKSVCVHVHKAHADHNRVSETTRPEGHAEVTEIGLLVISQT